MALNTSIYTVLHLKFEMFPEGNSLDLCIDSAGRSSSLFYSLDNPFAHNVVTQGPQYLHQVYTYGTHSLCQGNYV